MEYLHFLMINLLLDVLVCDIALYFYSLFFFNAAQLVKIYICCGLGQHFQAQGHSFYYTDRP